MLFVSFLSLPVHGFSQSKIGITSGITYTSISGDEPENAGYSKGVGYLFGLTGELNITKDLKICLQPQYLRNSTVIFYEQRNVDPVDSFKLNLDYFSLPVLLKIPALSGIAYFNSGVGFSYLSKSTLSDQTGTGTERDLNDKLNRFDFSVIFGFGLNFPIYDKFELEFEARYSQSLLNLSNGSTAFTGTLPDRYRSSGFHLITDIIYSFK